jgi:hypothetical protein
VRGLPEDNEAELMTDPLMIEQGDRFSLVVRLRVLTYPGRQTPVIAVDFSRRVWVTGLKTRARVKRLSAYAFPDKGSRAHQFTLVRRRQADGKTWTYQPDSDFAPLARHYLPDASLTTDTAILTNGPRLPGCKLFVVHKHGVGERTRIKSGVPDLDKLVAFEAIAALLRDRGLVPWEGIEDIDSSTRAPKDRDQHWRRRASDDPSEQEKYLSWLAEAQQSIQSCYAGTHHVVLGVQPGPQTEADALDAEHRLREILQESVLITRVPLPRNVHGPRGELPGNELDKPSDRAALRIAAWDPFITTVKAHMAQTGRRVDGVLVLARKWYAEGQADDLVNKRAARMALAGGLGVPVQYLLPRDAPRSTEVSQVAGAVTHPHVATQRGMRTSSDEFENRLMIAWLDLAYKSLGRVRPGKLLPEVRALFVTTENPRPEDFPERVLAVGMLRKNTRRFARNASSVLPYAIELDIASGLCTACVGYEDPATHMLTMTTLLPLPQALVQLARLGPVQLASKTEGRTALLQERAQAFFRDRFNDFCQRTRRPLILVDADTTRSVWSWLKDEEIDPENIHLAGTYNEQANWPDARLVRVRTNNSPKVLWNHRYSGQLSETGEEAGYRTPVWAQAQLFRLTDTTGASVYLSFGSDIQLGRIRGISCYRQMPGMKKYTAATNAGQHSIYQMTVMDPSTESWTTPVGVELFIARSGSDAPDQIARLVEWLRQCYAHFGNWTTKPAPLYFERALKEYLADYEYALDDGDDDVLDAGHEDAADD